MSHRVPRRLVALVTAVATALAGLVLLAPSSAQAASRHDEVWLKFEKFKSGKRIVRVANYGTARTRVSIQKRKQGNLVSRRARHTRSMVADFPNYSGVHGSRAVVAVVSRGRDRLTPRARPFTIGVDFKVDSAAIAPRDDGNNLLQRGNHGSPRQYKLQVDDGHIECRIKGSAGSVLLTTPTAVSPSYWYRAVCSVRTVAPGLQEVQLRVNVLSRRGRVRPLESTSAQLAIGSLTFPKRRPLSVGGKLKDSLRTPPRAEQFNGRLDNAFFRID